MSGVVRPHPASTLRMSCRRCDAGQKCAYSLFSAQYLWLKIKQSSERLAASRADDDGEAIWRTNERGRIMNLVFHFREAELREVS